MASNGKSLTGLWFNGQKHFGSTLGQLVEEKNLSIFEQTKIWLDNYFSGKKPFHSPPLYLLGTPFQIIVWKILQKIPYGQTTTYGIIAQQVAQNKGLAKMSPQAIGGAVSCNPISIIIPCHRVVSAQGKLSGYAGGTDKKEALLILEHIKIK